MLICRRHRGGLVTGCLTCEIARRENAGTVDRVGAVPPEFCSVVPQDRRCRARHCTPEVRGVSSPLRRHADQLTTATGEIL